MQDDAYLISADGWLAKPTRIVETDRKGKQKDKGWTCDHVPKALLVNRYFANEQAVLDERLAELEAVTATLAAMEEEHGGEDGVLGALEKVAKAEVNARLKEIKADKDAADEAEVLSRWLELSEREGTLKRDIKLLDVALDTMVYEKYPSLSETDLKQLVVDAKWMARLESALNSELEGVSRAFTDRLRQLVERYARPLPGLSEEVETISSRVDGHLQKMRAVWR